VSETALQRAIVKALETAGVWVIRTGVSSKRGSRGTTSGEVGLPDLCLPGLGWLEVKLPGGKLSPGQAAWHAKAGTRGIRVEVASTVLEALQIVTLWQIAQGECQKGARLRPKYLTRIK
jgi:hypothetical protein